MGKYSERVMGIGFTLIIIYWFIVLIKPSADPARAGTKKRLRWRIAYTELVGFCFVGITIMVIKSPPSRGDGALGALVGGLIITALLAVGIVQIVKAVRYNKRLERETREEQK